MLSVSWLFLGNVLIGYTWARFLMIHMNIPFTKKHKIVYRIGGIVQALFVEIAITWTSIAIAIAGAMTALKNEIIFIDQLTGLYNRVYLEFLQKHSFNKKVLGFQVLWLI